MYSDLRCIWMISNYIGVKYCEQQFDCENCPIDIVLRNIYDENSGEFNCKYNLNDTGAIDRIIEKISGIEFSRNILYLKKSWILKPIYANIFYIGLNPLMVPLLDNIDCIEECMRKVYYIKDQKLLTLSGDWGEISLSAPMNLLLLDKLNWRPEDIGANKWIALIIANQSDIQEALLPPDQWKINKAMLRNLMLEYKECCLFIGQRSCGNEKKISKFYQLLGNSQYVKLLNKLFNE